MVKILQCIVLGSACLLGVFLSGCASDPGYRNIKPEWRVRNSPQPVPSPAAKPRVRYAKSDIYPAPSSRVARPNVQLASSRSVAAAAVPTFYKVRPGDSVNALAVRYKVPASQIIKLNKLHRPYHLNAGKTIKLTPAAKAAPVRVAARTEPAVQVYHVRRGESLSMIAQRFGVPMRDVAKANGLKRPYALRIGQKLKIMQPKGVPNRSNGPVLAASSPDAGSAKFIWPVRGDVISGYGAKPDGRFNDGINIAAKSGAPIYAAAGGEVIFAGNKVRSFGNMVLIQHANGYVTAYAHSAENLVSKGQRVAQGAIIASAGSSGAVIRPQVHFEIRKGKAALNPAKHLGVLRVAALR